MHLTNHYHEHIQKLQTHNLIRGHPGPSRASFTICAGVGSILHGIRHATIVILWIDPSQHRRDSNAEWLISIELRAAPRTIKVGSPHVTADTTNERTRQQSRLSVNKRGLSERRLLLGTTQVSGAEFYVRMLQVSWHWVDISSWRLLVRTTYVVQSTCWHFDLNVALADNFA